MWPIDSVKFKLICSAFCIYSIEYNLKIGTIRNADIIFAFDKGIISEFGTHEDLMEKKGIYYNLVVTQQSNAIKKTKTKEESDDESEEGTKIPEEDCQFICLHLSFCINA